MKVALVGVGLIGGSLALALKESGFASEVIGVDTNPRHQEQARALGLIDRIEPLESAIAEAELVILATPVNAILKLLPPVLDLLPAHATLTDMGSTKETLCRAVESHPKRAQFVASHPMAGTENSGPTAAIRGLFTLKNAVICDAHASGPLHLGRVEALYRSLRMRVIRMSSSEHDLHTAFVSHLSHVSSFVLANTVLAQEKNTDTIFDLAAGGFESTVRLAKSAPQMWGPIFTENRRHVLAALDAYLRQLTTFRDALAAKDDGKVAGLMEDANAIRRVLDGISARREESK